THDGGFELSMRATRATLMSAMLTPRTTAAAPGVKRCLSFPLHPAIAVHRRTASKGRTSRRREGIVSFRRDAHRRVTLTRSQPVPSSNPRGNPVRAYVSPYVGQHMITVAIIEDNRL